MVKRIEDKERERQRKKKNKKTLSFLFFNIQVTVFSGRVGCNTRIKVLP